MARTKRPESSEARRFGVIAPLVLIALAAWAAWRRHPFRAELLAGSALLALACTFLAFPLWLRVFRIWMKLAEVLSWISTRVILNIFFYLILTPFAFLSRRFRRDPLDLSWKDGRTTYWIEKDESPATLERYERMF